MVSENGLSWEYNDQTNTVTISFVAKEDVQFVTLKYVSPEQIREAIKKINEQGYLLGGSVVFEPRNSLAVLKGNPTQLNRLQDLIARLETGEEARLKTEAALRAQNAKAQNDSAEAEKKAAEARESLERADQLHQQRLDIEQISVKVIPLHYASVGPVKIKFQGEDVTVPGLITSLKTVLGISNTPGSEAAVDSQQARLVNTPSIGTEQLTANANGVDPLHRVAALPSPTLVIRQEANQFRGSVSEDTRTNSVVVRGTPREIAQVEELVQKLDKPLEQIEIEAIIVLAQKGVSEQLGLKWTGESSGATGGRTFGTGGVGPGGISSSSTTSATGFANMRGLGTVTSLSSGGSSGIQDLISPLSLMPASGSGTFANFVFRGARSALTAQLNALSSDQKAQLLSAPRVVTLDNLAAKITDDRTSYIPTTAGANSSGSFLQVNAGLTLKITPSLLRRDDLGEDNMVRLVIEAENTSVGEGSVAGTVSKTGNQVQTQVVIPDGATFIMGGLLADSRNENREGIPLLQDIPVLGALFTVRDSKHSQQEVLFFITPRVVPRSELYARDVAQRRYLLEQRQELEQVGHNVRKQQPADPDAQENGRRRRVRGRLRRGGE